MAGWLVLNTDASKPEASGDAAIGAILRQKPRPAAPMKVVAYISEVVGPGGDPGSGIPRAHRRTESGLATPSR